MLRIYKYPLKSSGFIDCPRVMKVMSVGIQNGLEYVWLMIDDSFEKGTYPVYQVGTGWPAQNYHNARFLGTTVNEITGLVWHWFLGD